MEGLIFGILRYIYAMKLFLSSVATDGEGDMEWNLQNWANFCFSSFNSALAKIINKLLWLVLPGKIYFISSKLYRNVRELKQRRPRRQRGRQKSNRIRLAKEKLHVHHAFLYISLLSLHDYDVKLPNLTFCGGREHKTMALFFFFWTLIQSFRIQLKKNSPTSDE